MTQYFVDFAGQTVGQPAENWITGNLGTGSATVEVDSGDGSNRVYRFAPQVGTRHTVAAYTVLDADAGRGSIEVVAKMRFPSGLQQYYQGGGVIARVEQPGYFLLSDGYGACYHYGGYTTSPAMLGAAVNIAADLNELTSGAVGFTPAAATWYCVRFRCNGTSIKGWFWPAADTPKYNTDAADLSVTDSAFSIGTAGLRWDCANGTTMEVDWVGFGTDGDAAPMSAGGGGLSFPTPATAGLFGHVIRNR